MHTRALFPRLAALVALIGGLLAVGPAAAAHEDACDGAPDSGFTDTASNTHKEAIDCLAAYGVAAGTTPSRYEPHGDVTRGQMASFIARTLEADELPLPPADDDVFTDIDGSVHRDRITQMARSGVADGVADGRYAPNETVTRGQMAAFVVRAYEFATGDELPVGDAGFDDVAGSTHEEAIKKAANAELVRGTTAGTYEPHAPVQRDQTASLLAATLDALWRVPYCADSAAHPEPGADEVAVYFFCESPDAVAGQLYGVVRPADDDALTAAIEAQLRGPTEQEAAQGYASTLAGFDGVTLNEAAFDDSGRAVIDLSGLPDPLPEHTESFLPPGIMAELTWTAFHVPGIDRIEFRLDGSCDDFWQLLGQDDCRDYTRHDWEQV